VRRESWRDIDATLCRLSDESALDQGAEYLLKQTTRTTRGRITAVEHRLGVTTLEPDDAATSLELNEIGRIRLRTRDPFAVDDYRSNPVTGFLHPDRPDHQQRGGRRHGSAAVRGRAADTGTKSGHCRAALNTPRPDKRWRQGVATAPLTRRQSRRNMVEVNVGPHPRAGCASVGWWRRPDGGVGPVAARAGHQGRWRPGSGSVVFGRGTKVLTEQPDRAMRAVCSRGRLCSGPRWPRRPRRCRRGRHVSGGK
jgi:hypothetical protein